MTAHPDRLPLIVIGGGGHAKVLVSVLRLLNRQILGFADIKSFLPPLLGIPHLGDDSVTDLHPPERVRLVNGIGSIHSTAMRRAIYQRFRQKGFTFETVIHPAAAVASEVEIEEGVQIMAGVVVQPGSRLGPNSILNTKASVDHDCQIGAHAHLAPGVTLSGSVRIGEGAHIGTGATIIQGIEVGEASVVAAGAVVIRHVPGSVTVAGVPAAPLALHAGPKGRIA